MHIPALPHALPHATASRRLVLRLGAVAAAGLALPTLLLSPKSARAQIPLLRTPRQTEGPFYPDMPLADADADLLQNGSGLYRQGEPLALAGRVRSLSGAPVAGATVEIWQCDHEGRYFHSASSGRGVAMQFQGFGRSTTAADGS
jgi:protocatechuate 3,4-dioxygenase, beta subunit